VYVILQMYCGSVGRVCIVINQ